VHRRRSTKINHHGYLQIHCFFNGCEMTVVCNGAAAPRDRQNSPTAWRYFGSKLGPPTKDLSLQPFVEDVAEPLTEGALGWTHSITASERI
jgi:hypothetical protein